MIVVAISLCGAVSADTVAANDVVNGSVNVTASTNASNTSHQLNGSDCLPTVAHGTVQGEVYISSIANWPSTNTTNTFIVPNGTVVYAKYYVGVWKGQGDATSFATTFNGHQFSSTPSYYTSDMGVTWIPYDVTSYVINGGLNTVTSTSTSWGDGRQYGCTLVVVLQNQTKHLIEYWITEGLDNLHYDNGAGALDYSNTTLNGTVNLANVQNASLYSVHLTGYNYEDLNGNTLPTASQHTIGEYFDALRWDNIQGLLVGENQSVNVGRGSDSYTSLVFHALSLTYKTQDLVPVNLTPLIVTPNTNTTITATIKNQGGKDATTFNVSLLVDGNVVDTQSVASLAVGNSTTVDFHWTPDGNKNSYNLTVSVDPENTVAEYKEDNNILNVLVGMSTATKPVAEFTANTTSGKEPLTVTFTDQSSNEPTSWLWDFGDGTNSTDQNPIHPYTMPGVYNVTLTVTNAGGSNSTRKTDYIIVNAVTPVADFTTNTTSVITSSSIQFTDTSTHYPTEWFWDFGDGTTSTKQNPTHTYNSQGIYTVKLASMNSAGFDTEEKTKYITVYIIPIANFTALSTNGSSPLTVSFTDQSTNLPTSWLWDFGDGTTSTEKNPKHTYNELGTYTVKLSVSNLAGTNSTTKISYINVSMGIGPVWAANSAWNVPDVGDRAKPCLADLDGDGDYDLLIGAYDGFCYAYENKGTKSSPVWTANSAWDAPDVGGYAKPCLADLDGDGDYDLLIGRSDGYVYGYENTGTKTSPVWTRKTAWDSIRVGQFTTPCLADLDNDGDYDLLVGTQSNALVCGFENTGTKTSPVWTRKTAWDSTGSSAVPCLVDLDGDGDYDLLVGTYGSGIAYSYENTGTKTSPVWTRKTSWDTPGKTWRAAPDCADLDGDGDYDILIGNDDGISYAYENSAPLPGSKPDLTPTSVDVPSSIVTGIPCTVSAVISNNGTLDVGAFIATLSVDGVVVDTQSIIGPSVGNTSTVNFTWTPDSIGDHTLLVTVDSVDGIIESDETNNILNKQVIVTELEPVADFTVNSTSGDLSINVQFNDTSMGRVASYAWDFDNDGVVDSTEQNPTHTYSAPGKYTVKLTVTNSAGSDEEVKTDYITVNAPDLIVTGISPNAGAGAYMFANEPNVISVTVKNNGTVAAAASTLNVTVNGTVYPVNVPALAAGASTTVTVIDPVSRKDGDSVPVSAAANPDNAIPETNTSNNGLSASLTVYNNGYKGKRYTDGSDIDTQSTFQGNYDVIYSPGNSTYSNSGWISSIVAWTSSNLVVPVGATVVEARLYQPYTWDKTVGQPQLNVTFNGNSVNYIGWYSDTKGFGTSNYPSGLFVYDVTSLFNTAGNTLSITQGTGTNLILYGSYLVLVYQDPSAINKTIIINDGCDMLCSNPSNSVNDTEATAYSNFQNVNTAKFVDAKVIDILASADGGGGANYALFNGNVVGSFSSDYLSGPQIGFSVFNVTSLLQNGVNVAGMQSYNNATKGDNMVALNSILVITMDTTAPDVTASPAGGNYYAPQVVTLKADEAADIYYTMDGSTPTKTSTRYTAPVSVTSSKKLSYIGVDSLGNISGVKTQVYRIYKLVKYSYTVKTPYKKVWYRHWYKKLYKHWYKSHGKWTFKWRSYWKKGWAYHWKYKNTVKTGQKYVLT